MTTVTLTAPVAELFPEAGIWLVAAHGLDNATPWPEADRVQAEAETVVADGTVSADLASNDSVASWHEAYRAFGTNPKRVRPSVDALLRRVTRSGGLPRISPAVDTYNAVSVLTRHWNHRDCHRTMLRPDSRNALFILERASAKVPSDRLDRAAAQLAALLAAHADRVRTHTLSSGRPVTVLTAD